ncbi:MAG: amidohydrolase family protein [Chloroflexota bacterium]
MATLLIYNGTLIDGLGGSPIPDGAVLVKDNQIIDVGRKADIRLPDDDIVMIDANGGTILPGMIDTHVHMMYRDLSIQTMMTRPFSYQFYDAIENFRETIEAGVTTVRDAGGADFGVKQAVTEGVFPGPRIQISINLMSTVGGHADDMLLSGARMNLFSAYPGHPDGICGGIDGVREKVREMRQAGAEVIKICSTGGVGSPQDHPFDITFSQAEIEAIVEEASFRTGTRVMSHAQGAAGINNALRAGVHSIEHATLIDDEGIELALRSRSSLWR